MCKSEVRSSGHFRRTPEILQRSKGGRYKTKHMKRNSSSESYGCSATTISTGLDSFTFCSDDHLPHMYGNHLNQKIVISLICLWHTVTFRTPQHTATSSSRSRSGVSRFIRPGSLPAAPRSARGSPAAARPRGAPAAARPRRPRPARAAAARSSAVPAGTLLPSGLRGSPHLSRGGDGTPAGPRSGWSWCRPRRHGPGRGSGPFSPCPQGPLAQSGGRRRRQRPAGSALLPLRREGRCCLPGLASVRAAARPLPWTKRGAGGGRSAGPAWASSCFSFSSSSSRLAAPGRGAPGRWRGRGPGRAGGGGTGRPAPPQPGRVTVRGEGRSLRRAGRAAGPHPAPRCGSGRRDAGRGQGVLGCSTVRARLGCVPSAFPTVPLSARPSPSQSLSARVPEGMHTSPGLSWTSGRADWGEAMLAPLRRKPWVRSKRT